MPSVLQEWVMDLPWKQQSILLSGLRGPDHRDYPPIKSVNRWIRTYSQHNADPSKDYMKPEPLPSVSRVEEELEFLPCHYVHHFADSLRVIAINHPVEWIKDYARELHNYIAEETFHFKPETDVEFTYRHRDKVLVKD